MTAPPSARALHFLPRKVAQLGEHTAPVQAARHLGRPLPAWAPEIKAVDTLDAVVGNRLDDSQTQLFPLPGYENHVFRPVFPNWWGQFRSRYDAECYNSRPDPDVPIKTPTRGRGCG